MSQSALPSGPSPATLKKAGVYLQTGHVKVQEHSSTEALFHVYGSGGLDSDPYHVKFRGEWTCDCPARVKCAHVVACETISDLRPPEIDRSEDLPASASPAPDMSQWTTDPELDALLGGTQL